MRRAPLLERTEVLFLLLGEFYRSFYHNLNQKIPFPLSMDIRKAFATHAQYFTALGPLGYSDSIGFSKREWDFLFGPQRCFSKGNRKLEVDVISLPSKEAVRRHFDVDIEIARGAARLTCISIATHFESHSVVDASGDVNFDLLFFFRAPLSMACFTRVDDRLSRALTGGAWGRHAEKSAALDDLPSPLACGAGFNPLL